VGFKDPSVAISATVQAGARAVAREGHVADVMLPVFREPLLDVLEQREACEVAGRWDPMGEELLFHCLNSALSTR
jgi:hypothetical protein